MAARAGMDPLLVTGGRYGADSRQHRGMHSLPELSDRYQKRVRIVGSRRVYDEEHTALRSQSTMSGAAAAHWLSGEDEDVWVRRAVRNQTHDLKAAFRTADRQQRHRRNPRSIVQVMEREGGSLPAPEVRSILAQRGIPLTNGYWAMLCAYCAAPGTSAGVAGAPLTYARLLNRFLRESDPVRMEGALPEVSGKYVGVKEAQEMIRRSIMLKISGGPSELRRAFTHIDTDGSGAISKAEFKEALKMKANLVLDNGLLDLVLRSYGSDIIDYRKFCEVVMGSGADDSSSGVAHKPSGAKDDAHAMFSRKMRLAFREMKFHLSRNYPTGELTPAQLNKVLQRFDVAIGHRALVDMVKYLGAFSKKIHGAVVWPIFITGVMKGGQTESMDSVKPLSSKWIGIAEAKEIIRSKICGCVRSGASEVRRAFSLMDADGSGNLDLDEFRSALKVKCNLALEDDLMAAVWRSYDDNSNGILDYRKFVSQVMIAQGMHPRTPPKNTEMGDGNGGLVLPAIDMASPVGMQRGGPGKKKGARGWGGGNRRRGGGGGGLVGGGGGRRK